MMPLKLRAPNAIESYFSTPEIKEFIQTKEHF